MRKAAAATRGLRSRGRTVSDAAPIRGRAMLLVLLALACAPALALDSALAPVPLQLVLQRECGVYRNEPLERVGRRMLAWCPFQGTRLLAGTTDVARLAGRRLYVRLDLEPASHRQLPIGMTLTSFGAGGQVATHIGAAFQARQGVLEASIYIPADATSVYWGVSGSGGHPQDASLVIRGVRAYASKSTFQPGTMCTQCRAYLHESLGEVRREFLFAHALQMDRLESDVLLAAAGARSVMELDGPMKELSRRLAEATMAAGLAPHGGYLTRAEYASLVPGAAPSPAAKREAPLRAASFGMHARLLAGQVGYVRLRMFTQPSDRAGKAYARALREAIVALHRQGATRWVLDLREHGGGTLFPPLAALRPLLGAGAAGYFVDAAGRHRAAWLWGDPGLPASVAGAYFTRRDPSFDGEAQAVAILLGPATSSTGEMLAIAFQGRAGARSFGAPTAGYATVVHGAPGRHGNFFGFTAGYSADRNQRRIFPRVSPDVPIDGDPGRADTSDPVLDAALDWLATLP